MTLDFTKDALLAKLHDFAYLDEQTARDKYKLTQDSRNWKLPIVQQFLKSVNINAKYVKSIVYKPFDVRYTYYTDRKKGIVERSGYSINKHMLSIDDNVALLSTRCLATEVFKHNFVISGGFTATGRCLKENQVSGETCYIFPLFIIEEQKSLLESSMKSNFKETFISFINEKYHKQFQPQEILGYILCNIK
ncbi:type ISP restriction/modification enzyme, partial [Borrelia coriaceae]